MRRQKIVRVANRKCVLLASPEGQQNDYGNHKIKSGPLFSYTVFLTSEFHDQVDAKWIVIRGQLRGHNDTPFGRPSPGRPIGHPGAGHPQGVFQSL
jgi:hypothetical protein